MKNILITGCSSGFGLEIARYFLDRDWEAVGSAALFLTSIEGMYLLKAIGRGAIADSAMTSLRHAHNDGVDDIFSTAGQGIFWWAL